MRLTLLGTGSALPSPTRLQTGAIVERAGDTLLVDCGSGITRRLAQATIDYREVDTVLLTHTHLDHVADLPTLAKARLLEGHEAFTVVGPQGTRDVCDALFAVDELADRLTLSVRELPEGTDPFAVGEIAIERTSRTSVPSFTYGDLTDRPLYVKAGIGRNGADSEPSFGGGLSARVTRSFENLRFS